MGYSPRLPTLIWTGPHLVETSWFCLWTLTRLQLRTRTPNVVVSCGIRSGNDTHKTKHISLGSEKDTGLTRKISSVSSFTHLALQMTPSIVPERFFFIKTGAAQTSSPPDANSSSIVNASTCGDMSSMFVSNTNRVSISKSFCSPKFAESP